MASADCTRNVFLTWANLPLNLWTSKSVFGAVPCWHCRLFGPHHQQGYAGDNKWSVPKGDERLTGPVSDEVFVRGNNVSLKLSQVGTVIDYSCSVTAYVCIYTVFRPCVMKLLHKCYSQPNDCENLVYIWSQVCTLVKTALLQVEMLLWRLADELKMPSGLQPVNACLQKKAPTLIHYYKFIPDPSFTGELYFPVYMCAGGVVIHGFTLQKQP